mmetsp:Transcript_35079/g.35716  ORF Transcript_35079/g.35716 Transcript_35079/m.35716 type:complete len:190 (-) Transcript_35079:124-693(-)
MICDPSYIWQNTLLSNPSHSPLRAIVSENRAIQSCSYWNVSALNDGKCIMIGIPSSTNAVSENISIDPSTYVYCWQDIVPSNGEGQLIPALPPLDSGIEVVVKYDPSVKTFYTHQSNSNNLCTKAVSSYYKMVVNMFGTTTVRTESIESSREKWNSRQLACRQYKSAVDLLKSSAVRGPSESAVRRNSR